MSHFSAAKRRLYECDETHGLVGTRRRGGEADQSWVKPTEAAGAAEEAHRRWPEGRSEQGREQGKGLPSRFLRASTPSHRGDFHATITTKRSLIEPHLWIVLIFNAN
jgi:hypothetical protein